MQKRKEHTEMEILSLPTTENQKEFITFPSWLQEHNVLGQEWLEVGPQNVGQPSWRGTGD